MVTARLPDDGLYLGLKAREAEWADHGIKTVKVIGDANAPALQGAQGNLVALALLANQVFRGHAALVKVDLGGVAGMLAQLVLESRHHIAGRVGWHDEGADTFFASGLVGHGDHNSHIAMLAAGDELLDALQHIAVTLTGGRGAQSRGIGPDMGFGEAKGTEHVSLRQGHQPLLLLFGIAVAHQDGIHRAIGDADGGAGATVAGRNFLQHHRQGQVIQACAALGFWHANAVSPQLGQATVHLFGKGVLFVPACGLRPQLVLGKSPNGIPNHFLVRGQ